MKKILSTLLVAVMLLSSAVALVACGGGNPPPPVPDPDNEEIVKDIYQIISESKPTKTVTEVEYTTAGGKSLPALYTMEISGANSIFSYSYKKFSDPAVEGQNGAAPIVDVTGKVYYKDGKFSEDGVAWGDTAPAAQPLTFNISKDMLTDPFISEDGKNLIAEISAADAALIFGTDLNASGVIILEVVTGGTYVRRVKLSYTTESGATVKIDTSYSYDAVTLEFPVAE